MTQTAGNGPGSAADADARSSSGGRGTGGGESGAPSHRGANSLSGGLQLQLRRECRDVLRWFADGTPPGAAQI